MHARSCASGRKSRSGDASRSGRGVECWKGVIRMDFLECHAPRRPPEIELPESRPIARELGGDACLRDWEAEDLYEAFDTSRIARVPPARQNLAERVKSGFLGTCEQTRHSGAPREGRGENRSQKGVAFGLSSPFRAPRAEFIQGRMESALRMIIGMPRPRNTDPIGLERELRAQPASRTECRSHQRKS